MAERNCNWLYRLFNALMLLTCISNVFTIDPILWGWPLLKGGAGRGVLPYITYTGMCRPTGSWFWSSWFRTGYPFQRRFLERGIIFRTHESSTFVSSHLKVFKDRLLLKIQFNALTSKLLYSCCTVPPPKWSPPSKWSPPPKWLPITTEMIPTTKWYLFAIEMIPS